MPESRGIGKRLWRVAELRKSNFEGPQSQFRNFLWSATPQLIWLSAILRSCRGTDLNCGCPPLVTRTNTQSICTSLKNNNLVKLHLLYLRRDSHPQFSVQETDAIFHRPRGLLISFLTTKIFDLWVQKQRQSMGRRVGGASAEVVIILLQERRRLAARLYIRWAEREETSPVSTHHSHLQQKQHGVASLLHGLLGSIRWTWTKEY